MLGWIFKKRGAAPGAAPADAAKSPPPAEAPPAPVVDWTARLAQARGDDDALLALMQLPGVPLPIKQAAVEALDGEAALKSAERDSRNHDRRVHQLAKRRLLATVAQRQTREQAARLIATARHLVGETDVPVNRGVELDHAWQALDGAAIDPAQRDEFTALTAQLAERIRRQADTESQRKRWHAEVLSTLQQLQAACAEAAAGTQDRAHLAAAVGAARDAMAARPPDDAPAPATERALAELRHGLQIAAGVDRHLAVLDRLSAGSAEVAEDARAAAAPADEDSAVAVPQLDDPEREWQALPPLPDAHLAELLRARHDRWHRSRETARREPQAVRRDPSLERSRTRKAERGAALAGSVAQAEAALEAGQLADALRLLGDIDETLHAADAHDVPDALRTRIAAAQARVAQLRGWQHWAGGRARDELVLQAEALAAATVAGAGDKRGDTGEHTSEHTSEDRGGSRDDDRGDGEGDGQHAGQRTSDVDAEVARLSIRQRAEVIETLRARWKEIDRLRGAGHRALWQRFEAALKVAGEPVAAHAAAQRAARAANLSARRQLLDVLEAVDVAAAAGPAEPVPPAAAADGVAQPDTGNEAAALAPGDARPLASALDRFHVEWRKLGPLEHTVPRAERAALVERMKAALRRVEAPLQAARHQARAQRDALVARARALAAEGPDHGRDLVGEVRALQAEWQRQAKALPLARADEQALWTGFREAIDAVFAARQARFDAREAEFEAHAAERAALIERLRLRPDDSVAAHRRTLAEVETAWQRCGPAPRARAAALEAEYRAARDALRQWLDDSTQRAWQATCDALDAKLALCLAREQEGAQDGADVDRAVPLVSWQGLPALPAPLEDALRRRAGIAPSIGSDPAPPVDELLLQIETAWDLPTPPAFEAARRERKLLALKTALEGRRTGAPDELAPDAALAQLLSCRGLDATQRDRLAAVLEAWRRRGPQRAA